MQQVFCGFVAVFILLRPLLSGVEHGTSTPLSASPLRKTDASDVRLAVSDELEVRFSGFSAESCVAMEKGAKIIPAAKNCAKAFWQDVRGTKYEHAGNTMKRA